MKKLYGEDWYQNKLAQTRDRAAYNEWNRLTKDKAMLLKQQAELEEALEADKQARIAEIRRKAGEKDAKERAQAEKEAAKQALQDQKDALLKQKDDLEEVIRKGKDIREARSFATSDMRGHAGRVLEGPTLASRPEAVAAVEAAKTLKTVVARLETVNNSIKEQGRKDMAVAANF
jgi:chromosome segregation ATPase